MIRWLTRRPPKESNEARFDLDRPLLSWNRQDRWDIRSSLAGAHVFGASGSSKTVAAVPTLLLPILRCGYGALILTARPDDRARYERYVRMCGREQDLVTISPGSGKVFNFMDYELGRPGGAMSFAENVTDLLVTLSHLQRSGSGRGGAEGAEFFNAQEKMLARHSLTVLRLARPKVSVMDLRTFVATAADSPEQVASPTWQRDSYHYQCLEDADKAEKSLSDQLDFDQALTYFLKEMPALSPRTRGIVTIQLAGTTDSLCRGLARDILSSGRTNVNPEMTQEGAIVLVDLPVLSHNEVGQYIQTVLKFCWQRAHARRDVNANPRPTVIVIDESHLLTVPSDQLFQASAARSSRTAVIYSTQSICNYLEAMGEHSEARVHSMLGNFSTHLFQQQTCVKTIAYTQELIGRSRQIFLNGNSSHDRDWLAPLFGQGERGGSSGFSESMEFELSSADLNGLSRGGLPTWNAEAVLYQGGKRFAASGRNWMRVNLRQHI